MRDAYVINMNLILSKLKEDININTVLINLANLIRVQSLRQ